MEICIGEGRFSNIRSSAYWYKHSLDKQPRHFDSEIAAMDGLNFMEQKLKNPTYADLAMRDVIKTKPIKYPQFIDRNLKILERNPEFDSLAGKVEKKICQIYPKSYPIRKALIKNDRVTLNWDVMPKLSGFKKFMLKLKMLF